MRRDALVGLAFLLVTAPFAVAPVSLARFLYADSAAASLGTGSLTAPSSLAGINGTTATLTWTPSTSTTATGYQVLRSATSGSGYAQVGTVTPVSAATTADGPANGTWYYILRTYLQGWTSPASNEASVLIGPSAGTGYRDCTSNAAVTSGSGDNNGYESNATRACTADGLVAQDADTGTNTVNSCTDAGKDRHRFWGYSFGLPGSVTSIDGIAIRAMAGLNNNSATSILCVELSWDGGATWTTPGSVPITGTPVRTYALGGATDQWGHAPWTTTELDPTNFQVRVTDVSTVATKRFRLDFIGVEVFYTP